MVLVTLLFHSIWNSFPCSGISHLISLGGARALPLQKRKNVRCLISQTPMQLGPRHVTQATAAKHSHPKFGTRHTKKQRKRKDSLKTLSPSPCQAHVPGRDLCSQCQLCRGALCSATVAMGVLTGPVLGNNLGPYCWLLNIVPGSWASQGFLLIACNFVLNFFSA